MEWRMPLMKRELHRSGIGPLLTDGDCWRLVFDTGARRFYVEHEWEYVGTRRGRAADAGRTETDVASFLADLGQGPAHRELQRLLSEIFKNKFHA
jgi:hypothetical protein